VANVNDIINFLKKKGINDTLRVLTKFKNYSTEKQKFYSELNKFSYYNSFSRVKDDLIKKGIIKIEKSNNKTYISLTDKGLAVYNKLVEINKLIRS